MKKRGEELMRDELDPLQMATFFMPLAQLAAAGIKNKMTPEEVSDYFVKTIDEFSKKMENFTNHAFDE